MAKKQIHEVLKARAAEVDELRAQNQAIKIAEEGDQSHEKTKVG